MFIWKRSPPWLRDEDQSRLFSLEPLRAKINLYFFDPELSLLAIVLTA